MLQNQVSTCFYCANENASPNGLDCATWIDDHGVSGNGIETGPQTSWLYHEQMSFWIYDHGIWIVIVTSSGDPRSESGYEQNGYGNEPNDYESANGCCSSIRCYGDRKQCKIVIIRIEID